jgi:hypothetical protein
MVGSALLLSIVGSTKPAIGLAVVAGWIGVGVGLLTRQGERLAVRTWCRFRSPSPAQARALAPLLERAVTLAGITVNTVDTYIHPGGSVALIRWSQCLTSGVVLRPG